MADYPLTISSKRVFIESNPERLSGATIRYNVLYTDINSASATGSTDTVTLTLGTTSALWAARAAFASVTTAFAGTGAMTLKVGVTGTLDAFLPATSILSAGLIQPSTGMGNVNTPASSTGTSAVAMKATFTNATSGSPSALSAGALDIYVDLLDLSRLS